MKTGEIYWVSLDPAIGDEKKKRPVLVLNAGHDKHLRLAIVLPITAWDPYWNENPFFISLELGANNGLHKRSVVDCFQIRAISHRRFAEKIGNISSNEISLVKKSIALILDIEPEHCELDD